MFHLHITGIAMLVLLFASCQSGTDHRGTPAPVPVSAYDVVWTEVPGRFVFPGSVEGDKRVTISTKIMGQVTRIHVREGDRVGVGQPLVNIKNDDLTARRAQILANMLEARAALKNVETNHGRITELFARQSATRKELDDVEMAYQMTLAKVKALEEMEKEIGDALEYSEIVSPIQGTVVQKLIEAGNTTSPGQPLLIIEDLNTLAVVAKVPETEIGLFTAGQNVAVAIEAATNESVNGIVDQIHPAGNPGSRQYDVKVLLPSVPVEARHRIRSGMFARLTLESGRRSVVLVPDSLIIRRGQLDGLFALSANNEAILRWVRTGQRYGARVEVLSGLAAGERVLAAQKGALRDGSPVEVRP